MQAAACTSSGQSPYCSPRPGGQGSLHFLAPPFPSEPASLGFVWVPDSYTCGLRGVFSNVHAAGKHDVILFRHLRMAELCEAFTEKRAGTHLINSLSGPSARKQMARSRYTGAEGCSVSAAGVLRGVPRRRRKRSRPPASRRRTPPPQPISRGREGPGFTARRREPEEGAEQTR